MELIKLKWKDITGNTTGRIMLWLLLFFIISGSGFLIYTYYSQIQSYKKIEFSKLKAISNSLAVQIDGDKHEALFRKYSEVDEIGNNGQSLYYASINEIFTRTKVINHLTSDIYTLVPCSKSSNFLFGISSSSKPYFRHPWKDAHKKHFSNYNEGATVGPYHDENGSWLSAFSPIKNQAGSTVAIIQVDEPFDNFMSQARQEVYISLLIILILLIIVIFIMLKIVQNFLTKEDSIKRTLSNQRNEIAVKNRDILSSIKRAKTIQDAMLPQIDEIKRIFPEMFVMFEPRNIVSGDFFWFAQKDGAVYFAIADCTGHGVPGAFMSMIGHTILNDVLNQEHINHPADILSALDNDLTKQLYENGNRSSDGMDISVIKYEKDTGILEFSGAMRPLILISAGEIKKISGDKFSIGGFNGDEKIFTNHVLNTENIESVYMFTDGFPDQFGGEMNKKYLSRKFREFLLFANQHTMFDQQYLLQYEFHHWKDDEEQVDDVLVAGIRIPKAA